LANLTLIYIIFRNVEIFKNYFFQINFFFWVKEDSSEYLGIFHLFVEIEIFKN